MADQTTLKKKKPIILTVVASSLLFAFLGLFFLPNLISTDWAADKIKETVNTRIPGKIDFKHLSLNWFKGIQLREMSYDNPVAGIRVKVADVTTAKGLLALVTNYKELGAVNIKDPAVYVNLKEKTAPAVADSRISAKQPVPKNTEGVAGNQQSASPVTSSSQLVLPQIDGQFIISGGELIAVLPDKETSVVKNLELQVDVTGLKNLVNYQVGFRSGDASGQVKGKGSITLPAGDIAKLGTLQSQATLDIDNWEITDLLSILATTGNLPSGSGLLNGHLGVSGSAESGLSLKGLLTAENINLQGGLLKSDTPTLKMVEVELDAVKTATTFTVNKLALTSPLATGTASGTIGAENHKEITSKMTIDLAGLFAQFPASLKLKEGITISYGQIDINTRVSSTDTATVFEGRASLDQLKGAAGNKKLSLDKPIILEAKGEQSPAGLRLENFIIESSFARGKGQGDFNQMQVSLAADIGSAMKEIEKFIDIKEWQSTGKMNLNLQVDTKTQNLKAVSADMTINDFVIRQSGRVIAPQGQIKAKLSTDLHLNQEMRPVEMTDTTLNVQSWIGSGSVSLKNLVPASGKTNTHVNDLGFKGVFDLRHLATLLQTFNALPQDTQFSGKANIDAHLSVKDDLLELNNTTIEVADLLLKKEDQRLVEKKLAVDFQGSADLKKHSAVLKPVSIITTAGQINLQEIVVSDWSRPGSGVKSHGDIDLNLGRLTVMLGDFLHLPAKTTVEGRAAINLDVNLTSANQQSVQLDGTIKDFKLSNPDKPPLVEDTIKLAMKLNGDIGAQDFTLGKLELSTVPLSVSATGKVSPDAKERVLTSEGTMTLDLQAVTNYLKSLTDLKIEMTGTAKRPFSIQTTSTNRQWNEMQKNTALSTSFHADSIKGFGLFVESLDIPIKLVDGKGEIDIHGTVNKGKMALKPSIDFTVKHPVISMPEKSTLLSDVRLTEDLSADLLVHIHPIFKGAAATHGTVDMTMQNFSWPVEATARRDAAFAGALTFNDVKLQAGGLLAPLLTVMKVDEHDITLSDQPMEFVGEKERVRCSSLQISVNEYTLLLSGSIGFDQSLDYIAQVPVTEKMVSSDVYKYLEGTFITVPITGTVSNPSISKNLIQTALKDLIIQAGKKQVTDQAGKLLQKLFQ